jgi:tRNA A-37 threonylcarbamoyl transferase component Bud32
MDAPALREFEDDEIVPGTRFRVLGMVGQGGMSRVYDVVHVELEKRFVLKVLLREHSQRSDLVARLRNEWRALGQLQHPNIVNVTDAGTTGGGVPFYVMERLEGETLGDRLRQKKRLAVDGALPVAIGVLEGLGAAHQIGVVHRDVKPPNVFLTADGGVKLLDFGIAKLKYASDPSVTSRGCAVGTPRYMSPEQARGEHVDGRADLYAAGLLLFEMISGRGPFDRLRDSHELLLAHMGQVPPPLRSLVPDVPAALDELVACLLAKDPRMRPATARLAADALRQILESLGGGDDARTGWPRPGRGARAPGALVDQSTLLRFSAPVAPDELLATFADPAATHDELRAAAGAMDVTEPDATDAELTTIDPCCATTLRRVPAPDRDATTLRRPLHDPRGASIGDTAIMASPRGDFAPMTDYSGAALGTQSVLPAVCDIGSAPTVRLGALELMPPAATDIDDTRTHVPFADSGVSTTPPPVVPTVVLRPIRARTRLVQWAGLGAVAALSCAVAVGCLLFVKMHWPGSAPARAEAPSPGSALLPASLDSAPEPLPLPSFEPARAPSAMPADPIPRAASSSEESQSRAAEPAPASSPRPTSRRVARPSVVPDQPGLIKPRSGSTRTAAREGSRKLPKSGL